MSSEDAKSLKISEDKSGIPQSMNPALSRLRKKKKLSLNDYVEGIKNRNPILLSKAITLIESNHPSHQQMAQAVLEACLPLSGNSLRLGITGSPGVGKSTFIEGFGAHLLNQGRSMAVLAVDPSSQMTRGSILGDKTRMEQLTRSEKVFIRPSPSGHTLGGVARKTRETILLCEAAGYDTILIETVGVGQSEIAVHAMVDFFLLLLLPGGGDELQGIKRGIVEMADLIAVNKADGERESLAKKARQAFKNALHLFPPKASQWSPGVVLCSGITGMGMDRIWQEIIDYLELTKASGYFDQKRNEQAKYWLHETIQQQLRELFYQNPQIAQELEKVEAAVLKGKISSFQGAEKLLAIFKK